MENAIIPGRSIGYDMGVIRFGSCGFEFQDRIGILQESGIRALQTGQAAHEEEQFDRSPCKVVGS